MATKIRKAEEDRRAEIESLHESIATQVEQLMSSEGWARFIRMATGFHRYSLNNLLLILAQNPAATRVAGFRQWQDRGRQVRRGERGIRIFGYSPRRIDDDDEIVLVRPRFPVLTVFDISQTDAIEGFPEPVDVAPRLTGSDSTGIFKAVSTWLTRVGWSVSRAILRGEDGNTSVDGTRRVRVDRDLSEAHAALTIIHEAAHVVLHSEVRDYHQHRGRYETEAESTAYIVSNVLGLDAAANSVGYLASWSNGNPGLVREVAANVLLASNRILSGVDGA